MVIDTQLKASVRNPSFNEIADIIDLIAGEVYTENAGSLLSVTPPDLWKRISSGDIFCAYSGEEMVGTASLVEYGNGHRDAELATLYVKQEFRNQGISTMLKDKVVDRAVEKGHRLLYAYVNRDAFPRFKQWGFAETSSTPEKLEMYCEACPRYKKNCDEIPVMSYIPRAE